VIGFVHGWDGAVLVVEDSAGVRHAIEAAAVVAVRRVGVARGRAPGNAPRGFLDELAERAGLLGEPRLERISTVLAGLTPPAEVPQVRGELVVGTVRARVEGEWLTTNADGDALVAMCWWATRQGARSVQVRPEWSRPDRPTGR
jgi:hypothetical protein